MNNVSFKIFVLVTFLSLVSSCTPDTNNQHVTKNYEVYYKTIIDGKLSPFDNSEILTVAGDDFSIYTDYAYEGMRPYQLKITLNGDAFFCEMSGKGAACVKHSSGDMFLGWQNYHRDGQKTIFGTLELVEQSSGKIIDRPCDSFTYRTNKSLMFYGPLDNNSFIKTCYDSSTGVILERVIIDKNEKEIAGIRAVGFSEIKNPLELKSDFVLDSCFKDNESINVTVRSFGNLDYFIDYLDYSYKYYDIEKLAYGSTRPKTRFKIIQKNQSLRTYTIQHSEKGNNFIDIKQIHMCVGGNCSEIECASNACEDQKFESCVERTDCYWDNKTGDARPDCRKLDCEASRTKQSCTGKNCVWDEDSSSCRNIKCYERTSRSDCITASSSDKHCEWVMIGQSESFACVERGCRTYTTQKMCEFYDECIWLGPIAVQDPYSYSEYERIYSQKSGGCFKSECSDFKSDRDCSLKVDDHNINCYWTGEKCTSEMEPFPPRISNIPKFNNYSN